MFKRIITCITFAALCLCSCHKDNTLLYGGSAIGQYENSCIQADDGKLFHITENACEENLPSSARIIATFDILSKNSTNDYNIRIKNFNKVLCKNAVHEDSEELGNDPIEIATGWVSGGYLNILAGVPVTVSTSQTHFINMYVPAEQPNENSIDVYFRHNGHVNTTAGTNENYTVFRDYVSFPVSSILPEGKTEMVLHMHWDWYETATGKPTDVPEKKKASIKVSSKF